MGSQRLSLFFLLLLVSFHSNISRVAGARPLTSLNQERYVKVLASLGIVCQCCDGVGGACKSSWDGTCAKLDCHPRKFL